MSDPAQLIAALRGGQDPMPFGIGGPAEPAIESGAPGLIGGLASGASGLVKKLIDASTQSPYPGLRREDYTDIPGSAQPSDPQINASTEMAASLMGGSSAVPSTANELRMGIKAYHASPHDFDQFSLLKKGTGEGKADFGHGIYTAENPLVNKYYHDQFGPNAQTYHLDINAKPEQFLDWSKPLTAEQFMQATHHPESTAAVVNYLNKKGVGLGHNPTGKEIYEALSTAKSPEWATQQLANAGIPGMKYLDAGSRLKGEGTYNHVIYDPSLIEILKKEKGFDPGPVPYGASKGDQFRQAALDARDAFYHKDVAGAQREYQTNSLPLDARRIERGYTTPAYKGTRGNFGGELNPELEHNFLDRNFYSTSDPKLAELYAGKTTDNYYYNDGSIMPLYLNTRNYHVFDGGGRNMAHVIDNAKDAGKATGAPGVTVKNVWDEPSFGETLEHPHDVHVTFPEGLSTVKSKFAKMFDPNSTNILRGMLGAGAVPEMIKALQDQQRGP